MKAPDSTGSAHSADKHDPPGSKTQLNFNKACEIEDFAHKDLIPHLREACPQKVSLFGPRFPSGFEYNKDWEVSMALRALKHFGALNRDSCILGVAAGREDTLYLLTRYAKQVFATDRYLFPKEWESLAPRSMLLSPERNAPFDYDPGRLVVQHMDARLLRYPDDFFSGIFSSGSIEHFGSLRDIAASAYEMGRVLRPGGILSLSTVLRCGGEASGPGFPGTLLFTREEIERFIIEASGLEPVDDPDFRISPETMATDRNLVQVLNDKEMRLREGEEAGKPLPDWAIWDFPHLILSHDGYVFDSIHLALIKTARYPFGDNRWARPSAEIAAEIEFDHDAYLAEISRPAAVPSSTESEGSGSGPIAPSEGPADAWLTEIVRRRIRADQLVERARRYLEISKETRADLDLPPSADEYGTGRKRVIRRLRLQDVAFDLVLDPQMADSLSQTYLRGEGASVEPHLMELWLELVQEGDRVLDLGAFVGAFALAAAARGAGVVAVEASPDNVDLLRASQIKNGFSALQVIHAAVSDEPGTVDFYPDGPMGMVGNGRKEHQGVKVLSIRVDDLMDQMGWTNVSVIKLDVEGSEVSALAGMKKICDKQPSPFILYESNGHTLAKFNATPGRLLSGFAELGYTSYMIASKRLMRTRPDDFQPSTVVDYLALKGEPPALDGWRIEESMGRDERIERIVNEMNLHTVDHRRYMARALQGAGADLLLHDRVAGALDRLATDPEDSVRAAVKWWMERREMTATS